MTDIDLATIRACQMGDREAFRRLYDAYGRRVYALVFRYSHDAEEAADLTQEVFLRVYACIGSFRGECALATWIYRIAANVAQSWRLRPRPDRADMAQLEEYPAPAPGTQALTEARELAGSLEQAVAALPDPFRLAFILVVVEQCPYAEAAAILEVRVETVRMRVSRARKLLRAALGTLLRGGGDDL
jgi:RNA polymerase sigma-70 factor, ECF subfamily